MKISSLAALSFLTLSLLSCSTPQRSSGPEAGIETLVLLGTNDIHGTLAPIRLKSREANGVPPQSYEAGGAAMVSSYAQALREEFGDRFIWLDAGDEFQGSIESNLEQGAPVVQFFNKAGLTAATLGNHEFDFGLASLQERMKQAQYPYSSGNIFEKSNRKLARFPNFFPSLLFKAGNLTVGVIGLTTLDTPRTTRAENVRTLEFEDLKTITLQQSQTLRRQGAQIILITGHVGLKCQSGNASEDLLMRTPTDPQGVCNPQDEMVRLLNSLPTGTVDAVVAGHSHQVVHHWIAGIPVIQGGAFGRYLNVIYLPYDWSQKRVLAESTRIEGPIPVCPKVFQNQNDCNGTRPSPKKGRGPLVPPHFHGKTLEPDPKIVELLEPTLKKSAEAKQTVIGTAVRPIEHPRMKESELGNLVADALRHVSHADIALINSGGLRAPLEAGPITYEALFRSLPFENAVAVVEVTGAQLRNILRVAMSGSRGLGSVSGISLTLIDLKYPAPQDDLNGDGKKEVWETNRLLEARLPNGQELDPQKTYTLATADFLVTGGDDLGWPMSQIPHDRKNLDSGVVIREAVLLYLQEKKVLNSVENPLVDPRTPRLRLVPPKVTPVERRAKSHHKARKSKDRSVEKNRRRGG